MQEHIIYSWYAHIKEFFINMVIEICTIILAIIFYICMSYFKIQIPVSLQDYFNSDRLSGIAAFFAITIGIYIAVITILATSELGISKELLIKRLDRPLIDVIMAGIVENLISVGLAIFVPLNEATSYVLSVFLIISIMSFTKFVKQLIRIFRKNMDSMAKSIDEAEKYNNDMLTYVKEISKYCQRHMND